MKLAIISHTEHFRTNDGTVVGWGPTINEINHLIDIFDEIIHIAMIYEGDPPASALPYSSENIKFISIPSVGGRGLLDKLKILWKAPQIINIVSKTLKEVDVFQLRTPTGVGVFLIPFLTFFSKKKGWFKYAGNWNQKQPPLGYRIQRWMLKKQSRKVTINGSWPDQPKHCLTFENPCLSLPDVERGAEVRSKKTINQPLTFCFVGRLESAKGVGLILEALSKLTQHEKERIKAVHFVGDGSESSIFIEKAKKINLTIRFHGFLSRKETFRIYERSHVFLLPSMASEGFPKVIAEAMNFGCIPIVSRVSSIGQYVKHLKNGLVMANVSAEDIEACIQNVFILDQKTYLEMINEQQVYIKKFTYKYYNSRIKKLLDY